MLYRKITEIIENELKTNNESILVVEGARQVGKSTTIRDIGKRLYKEHYVEIDMLEDSVGDRLFANVKTVEDFYFQLGIYAGEKLDTKENTLVFIDEVQVYPELLTLFKFLNKDNKYKYIASGSLLGVALAETSSIPMGSIKKIRMYPMDFEEFLYANRISEDTIAELRKKFDSLTSLDESSHNKFIKLFKMYLLIGGLPEAVQSYVKDFNIKKIRTIHDNIDEYYKVDASKYDKERKLKIKKIYSMIPSNLESKKKRVVIQNIDNVRGKTYSQYLDEFDYLINSGIALDVNAITDPSFPLVHSSTKNLLKLYLNDSGLLSNIFFKNNENAVLDDKLSINLGSLYENAVASELKAHNHLLYYYDRRKIGEIDYLIDDYDNTCPLPLEVKSGKDYSSHSALNRLLTIDEYKIKKAYVLSNNRECKRDEKNNKCIYIPIYYIMFL